MGEKKRHKNLEPCFFPQECFQLVYQAFETLANPITRRKYDEVEEDPGEKIPQRAKKKTKRLGCGIFFAGMFFVALKNYIDRRILISHPDFLLPQSDMKFMKLVEVGDDLLRG